MLHYGTCTILLADRARVPCVVWATQQADKKRYAPSTMESTLANGIRADEAGRPRIIMLTESNYRVWSMVTEQNLRERKAWGHITRTALLPAPIRVMTAAVIAVPAAPGSDAVVGVPAVTRAMVEHDIKVHEDYDASAARANTVILQTLQPKDIMAVMMMPSAAEKWEKIATDYAAVSASMATVARTRFQDFKMKDGESVIQTLHRFDQLVNECTIQAVNLSEEEKTAALLTHPSQKWTTFMDSYATTDPLPPVSTIFRSMKSQEERWSARNDREYEEANYAGGGSTGGASGSDWQRRSKLPTRQPVNGLEQRICYCCGKPGHLAKDCPLKTKICDICKRRGHLASVCRSKPAPEKPEQEEEEEEKVAEPEVKPKPIQPTKPRLSFAKGTKRDQAREVEGMVVTEFLPDASLNEPEDEIEWLADSGASLHVCNDLNLMWSVSQLEESKRLKGLSGEVEVNFEGTVKLECLDDWGGPVVLHLYNTLFVPEAVTNLFSLQKVRKAKYIIVQAEWMAEYNGSCIKNRKGETVGHISEDANGRGTLVCKTLLPPLADLEKMLGLAVAVKDDAGRYPEMEVAEKPVEMPKMIPTPGFEIAEEVGQNWGLVLLPAGEKVVVQSPSEGVGAGARVPTIVLALPAAQLGMQIDWESEVSSDNESILGLVTSYETLGE